MKQAALPKGSNNYQDYSKQKKIYSYFQAIFMSFYSVSIYVDVRHRWKGFGALYLMLAMLVFTLPWALTIGVNKYHYYNNVLIPSFKQLPDLNLTNGELQFNKESPFFINNPLTKKPIIIIDTSGKITGLGLTSYPEAVLLITKYAMITRFANMPPSVQRFSKGLTGQISQQTIITIFENLKILFFTTLYPSLLMLIYSIVFTLLTVLAFLMKMFSKILLKYDINYKQTLRLSCVSTTPMLFLYILCSVFDYHNKAMEWTLFFTMWGYFIFAIRSNKYAARYPLVI